MLNSTATHGFCSLGTGLAGLGVQAPRELIGTALLFKMQDSVNRAVVSGRLPAGVVSAALDDIEA